MKTIHKCWIAENRDKLSGLIMEHVVLCSCGMRVFLPYEGPEATRAKRLANAHGAPALAK